MFSLLAMECDDRIQVTEQILCNVHRFTAPHTETADIPGQVSRVSFESLFQS